MVSTTITSSATKDPISFLSGSSEMSGLMRNYRWEKTVLGLPANWPTTLKTSLRLLLNSNHPMIIWWGPELIQFYNDAYCQTMDTKRHPCALGQSARECWAEIWETIGPQIKHVMSGQGATWHEEQLLKVTRHSESQDEWWTYGFSPIEDDTGIHGVLVVCNNVTEQQRTQKKLQQLNHQLEQEIENRKQAEAQLALQHQTELRRAQERSHQLISFESGHRKRFYETFLSHTPDLAYVFDLNHRFIYANAVLLKMWGKSWDEAIGKNCLELGYEPWHAAMHDREIEQVIATKQPVRGEVPFNGTFGRRIYDYIFVPVLGADGEVEVIAGTTRDVTERKEHEDRLQQLANDLTEANRRKTEFLATLAHELRNPLAPIRSGLELMRIAQPNSASHSKALAMMDRQLNQLVRLIDDLMEIARINSGKIELMNQRIEFTSVVTMAVEAVLGQIESAGHKLDIHIENGTIWLDADPARLAQVLSNLLTNAIKYTPTGGHIILKAHTENDFLLISITDNGIGIPQHALNQVFEMFCQVSKTKNYSQGGLGIGLSLVQSLIHMHGGTVAAHSDGEGKGSTFTVKLPLAKADVSYAESASVPREISTEKSLRILVADDNKDAANTLSNLLSLLGHSTELAYDGDEALNIAGSSTFDLIILDLGMPGLNGYEVAAQIRKLPHLQKATLAALTGWGSESHRDKTKAAGFNVHMTKPTALADIKDLLEAASHNT